DHRQTNSRVSARGLDDRAPGFEASFSFCGLDHAQSDTILHTAPWIQRFQLHEYFGPGILRNAFQPDDRCATDDFADAVLNSVVHVWRIQRDLMTGFFSRGAAEDQPWLHSTAAPRLVIFVAGYLTERSTEPTNPESKSCTINLTRADFSGVSESTLMAMPFF